MSEIITEVVKELNPEFCINIFDVGAKTGKNTQIFEEHLETLRLDINSSGYSQNSCIYFA